MQHNISIVREVIRRYMLQATFQSTTHEIDNQRPIGVTVAISSDDGDLWPDSAELVENALGANVAQVPDFICAPGDFFYSFRQTIMRVREHENVPRLFP
jgi:hypothetical protein